MSDITVTSADGTKLAARSTGRGSPLVLVHGAMADLNAFALSEQTLAERHQVWVFSRRGRGGSGDGPHYGIEREVEDILAVLAAAGEGAHLFGHSAGAFYTLLAAVRAPSLRTLSLYEPPLHADRVSRDALAALDAAVDAGDPDRALESFFPIADVCEEEVRTVRSQSALWETLRQGVLVFPREHRALAGDGLGMLASAVLPAVPLLYLYGELTREPVYPSPAEAAERWPQAHLVGFSGQRHLAPMFDPRFAATLLAFTTAHEG